MATFEELRKKRLQESTGAQKYGVSFEEAISKRKTESGEQTAFAEAPKLVSVTDTGRTAGQAFKQSVAVNVLPTLGGLGAGAITGAATGAVAGPIGALVGFIGGGITGAIVSKKAQDKVLEVTQGAEWKRNLDQSIAEDRQNHPFATLIGEAVPQLITFKASPSTLKQAFSLGKRALTDTKTLPKHVKTLQGKTELDALMNVAIGSSVEVSLETYQQAREGDFNALRIISSAVLGGVISDPNRLGVKLGFSPSGDAIIEEYNKFGSKTEAANIITKGDIPMIDRSSDALVMERQELSTILRGESEQNRFTNPRILQAERIAGTINKDVTENSDLNIYRLDGRDGPMRVGERVTANPFIADVYGGRINPESVVKAGDLVRTSKGDYVYLPKDKIAGTPVLPPVTNAVESKVQKNVLKKEIASLEEVRAQKVEAQRLADEPARLQKEAEELAIKQQVEVESQFKKETEQAQAAKISLEENIQKTRAEKIQKIVAERKRVETEHQTIAKNTDKQIETVTTQLRKDLNQALLDHTKRIKSAKTKVQKTKENIRYNNQKATLTAKAIKTKKKLRDNANTAKKQVVNNAIKIKVDTDKVVNTLKKEIKSIAKPKLEKIAPAPKNKTIQTKSNPVATTEVASPVAKTEPGKTVTTIGTKKVKSESIIKNAVQEAREHSKKAQELDPDVTAQMGTTFVEQRELSARVITEKGFDDALKFAIEASNAEVRKLNLDRSALYETLYKTAIKEGQFSKYRDELEQLALLTSDEVSAAAQKTSLSRLATENDPFRRVAATLKQLIDNEKNKRGSVFTKEVDELYAKLKMAGSEEDITKIINDNLC